MKRQAQLLGRLETKSACVCVIGQGYVGLSLSVGAANAGMEVVGMDIDAARVERLSSGVVDVPGVDHALALMALGSGRLSFATDADAVASADVVVICVPTPVADHGPDLSAIVTAATSVAARLTSGTLVVLESTTYPGTTEDVVLPLLETSGLKAGRDFALAFSPERIDPGNSKFGLANTPRIVGGIDSASTEVAAAFYSQLVDSVHTVSNCRAAELAKLLENTFRMVNIALVNELAQLCSDQGIDTWEVIGAAATKPFGFMPFYPGPGVGGHCIPLDPAYLAWQSRRDTGRPYRLVELAMDINEAMPDYVVRRIGDALGDRGVTLRGARIFALGVTYKPNVGDLRESAAVDVIRKLHAKGAEVRFHDPFVADLRAGGYSRSRSALTAAALARSDCVALLTPHDSYDLDWVVERAGLVFDARNAMGGVRRPNVVPL
jgi:UDP-N-acetyl-D-glucosamine dehydrogenase